MTNYSAPAHGVAEKTRGCANHDRELIHELSERFGAVERCEKQITLTKEHPELQDFWRELRDQDKGIILRLKSLLEEEFKNGSF